jgi:DNA-binding transcriptional LysR family regulator
MKPPPITILYMSASASALLNRLLARTRLRHVQTLVKVAELGSVQRAAAAIGMTQPAVTHIVSDMETLLEAELFQRHARGMRPTAVCLDLLPRLRQMLHSLGEGAEVVAARSGRENAFVRVAATGAAIGGLLVPALPAFNEAHPRLRIQVSEIDADLLAATVFRGDVDLVACREPAAVPQGWHFRPVRKDRFVVVCGPAHPLARRPRLTLSSLKGETWLLAPVSSAARRAFDQLALDRGWNVKAGETVTRVTPLLWAFLASQHVLAFVPASAVEQYVAARQLVVLPLSEPLPLEPLGLLVREDGGSEAVAALARYLGEWGDELQRSYQGIE